MKLEQYTIKSQEAIQKAQELAIMNNNSQIENIHILKGILEAEENLLPFIFQKMGISIQQINAASDAIIKGLPQVSGGQVYLSQDANNSRGITE